MNSLKTSLAIYVATVVLLFSVGGTAIRLYGETCGVNLFSPYSWFQSFILVGSPWCKFLNWIGYLSNSVMEMFWIHIATAVFGYMTASFPSLIQKPNLQTATPTTRKTI